MLDAVKTADITAKLNGNSEAEAAVNW